VRSRVEEIPLPRTPLTVAAADVAYSRLTHRMYAAVCCSRSRFSLLEQRHAVRIARFPYLPGLFAFRESLR